MLDLPTTITYQKYIYMCETILTEKTLVQPRLRKIHTESGRKGRETIRLGPPPKRKASEETWNYMVLERSKVFDPYVGHPIPGVQLQENKSS